MTNFNNQSNNNTNNNLNITNEETMNYLTTLQSLLTQITEEKATNEHLHSVLDNNKKLKGVVTSNNKVIKESIEEFEALLDCYKEENECLQKQYKSEGDLSSVVESQEAALALITDIKKVLIPAEEKEEVVAALSSQMEASTVAEEVVITSVVEENPFHLKGQPVITEVAVTNEDFLRLTGKPRPTSQEEFLNLVMDEECKEGLSRYTACLSREAQYDFWFKNQDIVCVYYWETFTRLEGLPTNDLDESITESGATALEAIEDCQAANQRLIEALNESTEQIEKSTARFNNSRKEEIVEEPIKPYAVGSEEGWLELIGYNRPIDEDDFISELHISSTFNDALGEYLISLVEKEYALFFKYNADILNREIESWIVTKNIVKYF